MRTLHINHITKPNGDMLTVDISLPVQDDFTWENILEEIERHIGEDIDSCRYDEITA